MDKKQIADNQKYIEFMKKVPKDFNSGLSFIKKTNSDYVIMIGSTIKNNKSIYELLGGSHELEDISSLHTAVREFIEEFFNIKVSINQVDNIVREIVCGEYLIDFVYREKQSISYFVNFNCFVMICKKIGPQFYIMSNDKIDIAATINLRNKNFIKQNSYNGLYEIDNVGVVYLSKILLLPANNFRSYTYTVLLYLNNNTLKSTHSNG